MQPYHTWEHGILSGQGDPNTHLPNQDTFRGGAGNIFTRATRINHDVPGKGIDNETS